jgi:hypothetical protein
MAQKLSTTAKKIIKLVNQTATGIYEDATSLNNETWFPGYSNSAPVESVVFKKTINDEANKIIKQVQGNLSDEDRNAVYDNTNNLLDQIGKSYDEFTKNQTRFGLSMNGSRDVDPETQQVGSRKVGNKSYPVYATFMDGNRVNKNISGWAGTNNTFAMCDIVCTIDITSNTGERVVTTLGKLQTLSYSIYQKKEPVRCLGNMNAKDYVYGQRTIAGSLVFAVFNKHWLVEIYDQLVNKSMMKNWHYIADEIPPFDITVNFANEYGYDSKMALYGVRLMTEGQVMSINDIYIENTYQFVATDIEYMDALNSWQSKDKVSRRYQSTSGEISSGSKNESDKTKTSEMKGQSTTNINIQGDGPILIQGKILNLTDSDMANYTREEVISMLTNEYNRLEQQLGSKISDQKRLSDARDQLGNIYNTQNQEIYDWYAKNSRKQEQQKAS